MKEKVELYLRTIRHMKLVQLGAQLRHRLLKPAKWNGCSAKMYRLQNVEEFFCLTSPMTPHLGGTRFCFLNLEADILSDSGKVDWNFSRYGKLWTYNLNYFEWLQQEGMCRKAGLLTIYAFIEASEKGEIEDGFDAYPLSLRLFTWGKFFYTHSIDDPKLWGHLYAQWELLGHKVEYHLMGNHLLENLFALLYGAILFEEKDAAAKWMMKVQKQLREQYLNDGAHYERSAMYHSILLQRILDLLALFRCRRDEMELYSSLLRAEEELKGVAERALGWLRSVCNDSGEIPLFNDAAPSIAPAPAKLFRMGESLGLSPVFLPLADSGFRRYRVRGLELTVDVGSVGPSYIPGHSHADDLTFELYSNGMPLIVDTGVSTYERNERRLYERGTAAHNTVVWKGRNSSEVWASFRVGRRSRVSVVAETKNEITAMHDGWKYLTGPRHFRSWSINTDRITLTDQLRTVLGRAEEGAAHFHFAPSLTPKITRVSDGEGEAICGRVRFAFRGEGLRLRTVPVETADGWNRLIPATRLQVTFTGELTTEITPLTEMS